MTFVPDNYEPPASFEAAGLRLEPLGPQHNERDHPAWMSSIDHIHATPGFDGPNDVWPAEMSLEQNLEDLEMHARHFSERSGFTYSVLDGDAVVGCLYIYPSKRDGYDAEARSWVTASRAELDRPLWEAVSTWLAEAWPFSNPFYAPR
ncbi:MAG: N-acetyltransferase [Acidimicrobiia bacterium]|nr:N-acetyltransferase [Acidimicrobiia bacterium]